MQIVYIPVNKNTADVAISHLYFKLKYPITIQDMDWTEEFMAKFYYE